MNSKRAFTLIELLVVISILAILASLILPVLNRAKAKVQGTACLNNLRQLTVTWRMYADDNAGKLARNAAFNGLARFRPDTGGWIHGWLDFEGANTDNTNTLKLIGTFDGETALFGKYITSPRIYKCPADRSSVTIGGRTYPQGARAADRTAVGRSTISSSTIGYLESIRVG